MYKNVIEYLSNLHKIFDWNDTCPGEASAFSRKAISATRSYFRELDTGFEADREIETSLSLAWTEAASKVRRISSELEDEFNRISILFSGGKVTADSARELKLELDSILKSIKV